jgi:CSLREA domain-containing protein
MSAHTPALARTTALCAGMALALQTGCSDRQFATEPLFDGPLFAQLASGPVVTSLADPGNGTCEDPGTGDGCTLREAIAFADAGATVTFVPGLTGTITLSGTSLSIARSLSIVGPGAGSLTVSGNNASRVFTIGRELTTSIQGLTLTNGNSGADHGGAIYHDGGRLTITDCVISGNTAAAVMRDGGGIYTWGVLNVSGSEVTDNTADHGAGIYADYSSYSEVSVTNSTISRNTATGYGGGIFSDQATLTITESTIEGNATLWGGGGIFHYSEGQLLSVIRSTISGNSSGNSTTAGDGGGIAAYSSNSSAPHTLIRNSTISGNIASAAGGGFENWGGQAAVVLSTITGNHAGDSGGGVHNWTDAAPVVTQVKGSLVWGNTSGTSTPDDVAAYLDPNGYTSLGHNLIGAAGTIVNFAEDFGAEGDLTGVTDATLVKLGPLTDNGGPTRTHALAAGSLAINAGTCTDQVEATVGTDQRGVFRPQGTACDIGAYESEETSALPAPDFTFDLSTLPAQTYGDPPFSVAGYASSTNSTGTIFFGLGSGSVGCSVSSAGMVTLTGAAESPNECIVSAFLTSDLTYSSAGPLTDGFSIARAALTVTANDVTISYGQTPSFSVGYSGFVGSDGAGSLGGTLGYEFAGISPTIYASSTTTPTNAGTYSITPRGYTSGNYTISYVAGTFTINKAAGSVMINNIPAEPRVGESFTPNYTKLGDGNPSTVSNTPLVCAVSGGMVSFVAEGACTLVASVTEGTNHQAATGAPQSFDVAPDTPTIEEMIADVKALGPAGTGTLNRGQTNTLVKLLEEAQQKLDRGQDHVAVNKLREYIGKVEQFIADGVLTNAEGEPLIDDAQRLIEAILEGE